jgi:Zn-dependent protease with chaperone function
MHLSLFLIILGLAVALRLTWQGATGAWRDRWHAALRALLLPPLLLTVTAIAVITMGHHGKMMGLSVGWLGCTLAWGWLITAFGLLIYLVWQGGRSLHHIQTNRMTSVAGKSAYLLETSTLFAAQVGFWNPVLVVSQGLVQALDAPHLRAVLMHEQAHRHYQDTFWFFGLGWLRYLTGWLPNTEALWQELVLLRELRADGWAAQRVDSLVLAESLLHVVQAPMMTTQCGAAFGGTDTPTRLEERIAALLSEQPNPPAQPSIRWMWLALCLLPLLTLPLHQ